MLGRVFLVFAIVAFFILGILATVDFVGDHSLRNFQELTACFYFSWLHKHVLSLQAEMWYRDIERGG